MITAVVVVLAVLGLLVGSFLNVVIARVPEGRSIVRPRSACPKCGSFVRPRDNVPVISWLLLHGRCRDCAAPISVQYPLVEAGNAVLWALLGSWALLVGEEPGLLPLLLVLASAGLSLAVIDAQHHRLPNAIVMPLWPITLLGLACAAWIDGTAAWTEALLGAVVWTVVIGGLWALTRGRGMGLGDVKLAPVLGSVLGWLGVGVAIFGLVLAFAVGATVGLVALVSRRSGWGSRIAFGPFLLIGALAAVLAGDPFVEWYLRVSGL